jgi:D-alanyl-D-alanine carboxypeptidase (penicillin-binding protein 5/6)
MYNENKLLWTDPTVDGIKTGYTAAAENCLVASMTKNGRQFIGVILKSPGHEIWADMQTMFDYGFTQFKDTILKPSGAVISTITVNNEPVNLILDQPIYMTQKLNEQSPALNLRVIPAYTTALTSVNEGQVIANVEVLDGKTLLNTIPLKSARSISPPTQKKTALSHSLSWIAGLILMFVVIIMLVLRKIYADRRWRSQIGLP